MTPANLVNKFLVAENHGVPNRPEIGEPRVWIEAARLSVHPVKFYTLLYRLQHKTSKAALILYSL